MLKHANAALSMVQRGTLTRLWDYSPGLVIALAIMWFLAIGTVALLMHVHVLDRKIARKRNTVIPSAKTETKTVNLRKVA